MFYFHRVLGKASTTALSDSKLKRFAKAGQDENLDVSLDDSIKNKSSIAFVAEDGPTRILLLGDAVADIFLPMYDNTTGTPIDFTLMKVSERVFHPFTRL